MDSRQRTLAHLCDSIQVAQADPSSDQGTLQVVERLASHLSSGPSTSGLPGTSRHLDPTDAKPLHAQIAAQRLALARLARGVPVGRPLLQFAAAGKSAEILARDAKKESDLRELLNPPGNNLELHEIRERLKSALDAKLDARQQALHNLPDGLPNEVRIQALLEQKQLKLLELQRQTRRKVRSENWLENNVKLEGLMEWGNLRRRMPEPGQFVLPIYQHCPPEPAVLHLRPNEEALEVDRYHRYDDDIRRQSLYRQVNEARLAAAKKIVEEEKRQKDEEDRAHRLEQEMKMRAIQQRRAFLQDVLSCGRDLRSSAANSARRRLQRSSGVRAWHSRELKNMSRQAAARVRALKEHDYDKYLELARNAKDDRLRELMKKTDDIIIELGLKVQDQRKEAKADDEDVDEEMNSSDFASVLRASGENSDRFLQGHLNYYNMVHHSKEVVSSQPSMMVGGSIRGYQLEGLRFLISLHNNRLNGILADEMGLGKTIQTIGLLVYLMEYKDNSGPHVVIAPKAVLHNWIREFEKWVPTMEVIMYDGTAEERKLLRQELLDRAGYNVVVTHYDLVIRDKSLFKKIQWEHLIVDEGHRLKNSESKLFEILRDQKCRCRILLTGTPIQNSLNELWALLNFLLPKVFHCAESFDEWFASPFKGAREDMSSQLMDEEQLLVINRLHQVIRPFMLRRTKKEVEKELPSKVERIIKCDLSAWQRIYYRQISEKAQVRRDGKVHHLNNISMHMRKACNHPYLFIDRGQYEPKDPEELIRASGKLELLNRVLPKLQKAGHRVLLFSQMTAALNIIEEFLEMRDLPYLRLDGTTKTDERRSLLDSFNEPNSPYFIFLLSTRAGGLGLNLQTADTVIMFDSDWNPAMDLQAEDRAHRIGQKRDVLVIILVCAGTVEEVIQERACEKRELDAKVIQAGMFNNKSTHSERQQALKDILSRGEGVVGGDVPSEEEVNELIARTKDEVILFGEMDEESQKVSDGRPKLMMIEEVPSWVTEEDEQEKEKSDGGLDREEGHRKRRRRKVAPICYTLSSSSYSSSEDSSEEEQEAKPSESDANGGHATSQGTPTKYQRTAEGGRCGTTAKRGRIRGRGRGRGRRGRPPLNAVWKNSEGSGNRKSDS